MSDGYDNPSVKGSKPGVGAHGVPNGSSPHDAKKSGYDNVPNTTKTSTDGNSAKPAGGGGSKSGYDNIKNDKDFGFSGTKKNRSPNI